MDIYGRWHLNMAGRVDEIPVDLAGLPHILENACIWIYLDNLAYSHLSQVKPFYLGSSWAHGPKWILDKMV